MVWGVWDDGWGAVIGALGMYRGAIAKVSVSSNGSTPQMQFSGA